MLKLAYFDDEKNILEQFTKHLITDFEVVVETVPYRYVDVLSSGHFDAIIIGMEMTDLDGIQLFEKVIHHSDYNGCPILFLTDDAQDNAILFGLQLGAEDVILRSWSPEIQAERVKQRVQRYIKQYIFQLNNLRVDKKRFKVTLNNNHIELSLTEFKLVCCLVSHYPNPAAFADIFVAVWGSDMDDKNLHTHLSNLRKKLRGWSLNFKTAGGRKVGIVAS